MKRRIVPGGILALSLAVVLLAAMASSASAERVLVPWYCPPPPTPPTTAEQVQACIDRGPGWWDPATGLPIAGTFDFGDRQVGTTSNPQRFALGVTDNDSFNPTISVSGDYAQTTSCPPTLSAGADPPIDGCLIAVTFAPTSTGPKRGTLSTGTGGPTATLTGNGVTTPTPSPDLQLSGKKKQHPTMRTGGCGPFSPSTDCSVKVTASCGVDPCTARAKGNLTKVKNDKLDPDTDEVWPHETRTLGLRLTKKMREEALKAVDKGKNVQAKVTVRATDEAGNVATAKRTITLK